MPQCRIVENISSDDVCEFGCNQPAKYLFYISNKELPIAYQKYRKCCSAHYNSCPGKKDVQSKKMSGAGNSMWGKKHKASTLAQMKGPRESISKENHPRFGNPHNFQHSEESKKKISISVAKNAKSFWKKTLSGKAHGIFFRSTFELFYILQCWPNIIGNMGDNSIIIPYQDTHHYVPDFICGDTLVEVKPKFMINDHKVILKANAAIKHCANTPYKYKIVTEDHIEFNYDRAELAIEAGHVIFNNDGLIRFRSRRNEYETRFA